MAVKPIIGITKSDRGGSFGFYATQFAVILAGGRPVVLKPSTYKNIKEIDGLIINGGTDVYPGFFGQQPKPNYPYDHPRDAMEMELAKQAIVQNKPAMGICRGAQLMNVLNGGTLHMNVSEAYEDAIYPDGFWHHALYRKNIYLEKNSFFHRLINTDSLKVNSIHKQAIAKLGKDIKVDAQEKNGVIQAIHLSHHLFYFGMQFHPEYLIYRKKFRDIFVKFIHATQK